MKKKILLAVLLLLVGVNGVVGLSYYIHGDNSLKGNYINLIPPPPQALASDYGNPLVTTDIGLFAYYEAADWDLNDVIPAFLNYTQYSNYVDGFVRVHSNVKGTTFEGGDHGHTASTPIYIDVRVRVRSDGWILAWLTDTQNKAFILHWGDDVKAEEGLTESPIDAISTPDDYGTCLSRAIYRVYHNAGVSWIGYDKIFYYDYEFTDATRLYVFGDYTQSVHPDASANSEEFYFIVPNSVTIEHAILAYAGHNASGDDIDIDYADRATIVWGTDATGWSVLDITGILTEGTKHLVELDNGGSGQGESIACGVIMWTS